MDFVAHTLLALCITQTRVAERLSSRAALWTAIIAANLADLDVLVWGLFGTARYLIHSMDVGHSLLALLLLPPVVAWAVMKTLNEGYFKDLWTLAVVAYASHLALDICSNWGVSLLAPFLDVNIALNWLFYFDVVVWGLLSLPLWLHRFVAISRTRMSVIALWLTLGYIGICGASHTLASSQLASACEQEQVSSEALQVYASGPTPMHWNTMAGTDDYVYQLAVNVFALEKQHTDRQEPWTHIVRKNLTHPAAQAAVATKQGAQYVESWAQVPYAEVYCTKPYHYTVVLKDLRFLNPWFDFRGVQLFVRVQRNRKTMKYEAQQSQWSTPFRRIATPIAACESLRKTSDI